MKVLIIEDEPALASNIVEYLSGQNYLCELAPTYARAIEKLHQYHYDCILLDIMLPDGDGIRLLEEIKRYEKEDGVIIISAKDSLDDKIRGLEIGADDYLTKPFHLSELAARMYAVIRRKKFGNANKIQLGKLEIDITAKCVTIAGKQILLTKTEFDLLLFFIGNPNKVISKGALAEHLSGDYADMFDNHDFIYAHVKNLKKKLSDAGYEHELKTVYGTGYKWER